MSIVFSGGGTAGPLTSLLSIAQTIKEKNNSIPLKWIAPIGSVGRTLIEREGIEWKEIVSAKAPRYFSLSYLFIPLQLLVGIVQSAYLLAKWNARVVVTAGSFVSPPVIWWAKITKRRVIVIQLDPSLGLANKMMLSCADIVCISWRELEKKIPNAQFTGLPTRKDLKKNVSNAKTHTFSYDTLPLVLVVGGGTGASGINSLIWNSLSKITTFSKVVHVTGIGKNNIKKTYNNYIPFEFLFDEYAYWLYHARVVISRAGMGAISDFILFGKPSVLIPMENTHQEFNAAIMESKHAALVWKQSSLTPQVFSEKLKMLLSDDGTLTSLSNNIAKLYVSDANDKIVKSILTLYEGSS